MASESLLRPAAVMPPFRLAEAEEAFAPPLLFDPPLLLEPPDALEPPSVVAPVPRAFAQRARAAAASLARVAGDIGRRRPSCFAPAEEPAEEEDDDEGDDATDREVCPPAPKRELSLSSRFCICSRIDTASFSFSKDRSMASCSCYAGYSQLDAFGWAKMHRATKPL